MALGDYKEFLVKILTFLSGICLFILGFSTVFSQHTYTSSLVCFYLMLFSTIIILTELSPYILGNYLVALFPFLDKPAARGVFYALLGTFCFGDEMGSFGLMTGVCVIMAGVLNILFSKFSTKPTVQIDVDGIHFQVTATFSVSLTSIAVLTTLATTRENPAKVPTSQLKSIIQLGFVTRSTQNFAILEVTVERE